LAGHVAYIEEMTNRTLYSFCLETSTEEAPGDLGVDVRIILKRICEKQGVMAWTGFNWLGVGSSVGNLYTQ
jgi:hypothetical protein